MLKYCQTVEKEQVERKEPMQRAAEGVSAVRIPRFEWTFEGEPKGCASASSKRDGGDAPLQRVCIFSYAQSGRLIRQAGWHRRIFPVPA